MPPANTAEARAKIYPPVQELYILLRQVPPNRMLWMLALVIPGETIGTFAYSDKRGPSLSSAQPKMHLVFDRRQSLLDPIHKVLFKECIGHVRLEDLHRPGGYYQTITRNELDDLNHERWILTALLFLTEGGLLPEYTFRKWSSILASIPMPTDSPSSSHDSMQAYECRPYRPESHCDVANFDATMGTMLSSLDSVRISHSSPTAREPIPGTVEAKPRLASQGRGPSTPRAHIPRTRMGSLARSSPRSGQPSSLKRSGRRGPTPDSSAREDAPAPMGRRWM